MSNDPKRRPSAASKRAHLDERAEPNSGLPQPEALITGRGRGRDSTPAARMKGHAVGPQASQRPTERELRPARVSQAPRAAADGLAAIRQQLVALQKELAQAHRRIESIQSERGEEADRASDLLAQLNATVLRQKEAEAKLVKAEQAGADVQRLAAELEKERATSAWLRAAGEQATREAAAFRARAADEADTEKDKASAADEVARLKHDLAGLSDQLAAVRADEATARAELGAATARLLTAEREVEELADARDALGDATRNVTKLEGELSVARADAASRAKKVEQEVMAAKEEADAEATRLKAEVAAAKAEASGYGMRLEEEVAAARAEAGAEAQRLAAELATAKTDAASRMKKSEQDAATAKAAAEFKAKRLESELAAAKAEGDARGKKLELELAAARGEASASAKSFETALQAERQALAKALERFAARGRAVVSEVDASREVALLLSRSLSALAAQEDKIGQLRLEALASRTLLVEQTEALRLALARTADAVAAEGEAGKPSQRE